MSITIAATGTRRPFADPTSITSFVQEFVFMIVKGFTPKNGIKSFVIMGSVSAARY